MCLLLNGLVQSHESKPKDTKGNIMVPSCILVVGFVTFVYSFPVGTGPITSRLVSSLAQSLGFGAQVAEVVGLGDLGDLPCLLRLVDLDLQLLHLLP